MTRPVKTIATSYSMKELSQFLEIMEGRKASPAPETKTPKNQVIVKLPETRRADSFEQGLNHLEESGFKLKKSFSELGMASGTLTPEKAEKLEKAGFTVYPDEMNQWLPEIPGASAEETLPQSKAQVKSLPWDWQPIDPIAMTKTDKVRENYGLTGKGRTVAVLDSGFNHPEQHLKFWQDFTADKSPSPIDPCGHGTHVASDVMKMAPDAELISLRVMNEQGMGMNSWIISGIQWAVKHWEEYGIDTLNLSFGSRPNPTHNINVINDAVLMAEKSGLNVVVSAGNLGPKATTVGPPGELIPVLTVGAALDEKTVSYFSSRGPTMHDDAPKPDVMGPGQFIVSPMPLDSTLGRSALEADRIRAMKTPETRKLIEDNPRLIERMKLPRDILSRSDEEIEGLVKGHAPKLYVKPGGMVSADGTSFSCPEVAGITLLMKQADPQLGNREIKTILMDTARDMGAEYSPLDQGKGMVDAEKAVKTALDKLNSREKADSREEDIPAYIRG